MAKGRAKGIFKEMHTRNEDESQDTKRLYQEEVDNYQFTKTRALIHKKIDENNAREEMISLLETVIELLNYPGNDFCWSSWENAESAIGEIKALLEKISNNNNLYKDEISFIFAPTGPLQEVSLSSGWSDVFLKIAEKYDALERVIWK
jgi:hypothetical protein